LQLSDLTLQVLFCGAAAGLVDGLRARRTLEPLVRRANRGLPDLARRVGMRWSVGLKEL